MEVFYLSLLFSLTIMNIVNAHPPNEVFIRKISQTGDYYEINVTLKKVHSLLANEHLPVWVVNAETPKNLIPLENVMKDVGSITMYQDTQSCSAAVYFQKDQHFDGTIDQGYIIKELGHDPMNNRALITVFNLFSSEALIHPEKRDDSPTGIHPDDVEFILGSNWKYIESRIEDPQTVYIETLVIVNYDVVVENSLNKIVSDVLVTMNSVDMIYSTIEEPRMKINIAGIIIGNEPGSFPLLVENECYIFTTPENIMAMDANCVNHAMKLNLDDYQETIPFNSYDVVIFLTNLETYDCYQNGDGQIVMDPVMGLANVPVEDDDYIGYTLSSSDIPICTIQRLDFFQHFSTIAHEMAHLFNVLHEPGEFLTTNGDCKQNLMKSSGSYCGKCLYFGSAAREQIATFFKSRDGCKFRNQPRSLNEPWRPQLFWNEHKQCQCYGFLMAKKPQEIDCAYEQRLECIDDAGNSIETGFFMDGTVCNRHECDKKVCWNGKCERVRK